MEALVSEGHSGERGSYSGASLGIIGGGQLGMYLCEAAQALGVTTTVLMSSPNESAAYAADATIIAGLDDLEAVQALIALSDVITFELEAVPEVTLKLLEEAEARSEVSVMPRLQTMRLLKDKGVQKNWLLEQALPTLPFNIVSKDQGISLDTLGPLSLPLVQKACRGGYDGKGVQMIRSEQELKNAWPVDSVLEPLLEHRLELSVIVARGRDGSMVCYPAVSMEFAERFNAVSTVVSPAAVSDDVQVECEKIARQAVNALAGVGVFAVEFFVADDNSIYINEISPRVHNSGHLTMEAFAASQFEQHVRAVMGMPLAPIVKKRECAVMLNILYDESWQEVCPSEPCCNPVKLSLLSHAHWYGKSPGSPGRKMGHVTTLGNSGSSTEAEALRALDSLRATDFNRAVTSTYYKESVCH